MAKVLTGISGNLISAASAGFAPTNSADVSAIASAYQVVSATATQLYAGTAYVTSVNGAPLSASRAGNAANASLATSAWYDGTGRLISSLPDSASVSAIASAYAESAASSKQDELTFSYDDDKISAINGSALAGQGGGELVTSIQSALDPWYQTSISGLNGSSLYPKWAKSALSAQSAFTADWARVALSASAAPTAWASSFITGVSSPSGTIRVLGGTAIESTNSAVLPSTVIEGFSTSYDGDTTGPDKKLHCVLPTANPSTEIIMPFYYGSGVVLWSSDNGIEGSQEKDHFPETITAQVPNATAVDIWADSWILVDSVTASAVNQEIGGGVGELAWASALPTYSYDAEDKISAINGSAIAGGAGGVDSATVSAIASSYAESAVSSYQPLSGMSGYASAFSAGEGLEFVQSGSDQVLQVEAPVDIVAGPGITIDNPDGNTLRVSQSYPTDETVLFEDLTADGTVVASVVLSETSTNFEEIEITIGWKGGSTSVSAPGRIIFKCKPDGIYYGFGGLVGCDNSSHFVLGGIGTSGTTLALKNVIDIYSANLTAITPQSFNNILRVYKVVGIHRIANN